MICSNCQSETGSIKSIISNGTILTGCDKCLTGQRLQKGNDNSSKYYKREQQTKFRKELTQPFEPREFIKAYGHEAARSRGMSDEFIRKNSI